METYKDNPQFTRRRPNVNLPLPQYKSTKKAQLKSRNQHARLMLLFHGVAKRRTFLDTQKAKRYENSLTQPSDLRLNTRILSHGLLSKFLIKKPVVPFRLVSARWGSIGRQPLFTQIPGPQRSGKTYPEFESTRWEASRTEKRSFQGPAKVE